MYDKEPSKSNNPKPGFFNQNSARQTTSTVKQILSHGYGDFNRLRKIEDGQQYYFVDKSMIIHELFTGPGTIKMIHQPRQFGKSVLASMLTYFASEGEEGENKQLFEETQIWDFDKGYYRQKQGQFTPLYFSWFAMETYQEEEFPESFNYMLEDFIKHHLIGLDDVTIDTLFAKIRKPDSRELIDDPELVLSTFIDTLYAYHGKKIIMIIDHYDEPLTYQYSRNQNNATPLLQQLLKVLVDNPKIEFSVLFGIEKIDPKTLFSNTDEVTVYSNHDNRTLIPYIAFTRDEVTKMLIEFCGTQNIEEHLEQLSTWFRYYKDSTMELFNPCDIILTIQKFAWHQHLNCRAHWEGGSNSELVFDFLRGCSSELQQSLLHDFQCMLNKETITKKIEPNTNFYDLKTSEAGFWSFLINAGYLSAEAQGNDAFTISIPNKELSDFFQYCVPEWFKNLKPISAKEEDTKTHSFTM